MPSTTVCRVDCLILLSAERILQRMIRRLFIATF